MTGFFESELEGIYPGSEIRAMTEQAVEHILGFSRTELLLKQEERLNQSDLLKLYDCAKALRKQVPLHYILGEAWFYGLPFRVNPDVLIPRPETEELVALILEEVSSAATILDIGTGSGCIPVALKKHRPAAQVSACDISPGALALARENAARHKTPVTFFETDILSEQILSLISAKQELMVSNPPYIQPGEKSEMAANVLDHEPHLALFAPQHDPVIFYRRIIDLCPALLAEGGRLYFELNPLTAEEVRRYAIASGLFSQTALLKDLSGAIRFFKGIRHPRA
jgi:release factor glutamine methyltransferase